MAKLGLLFCSLYLGFLSGCVKKQLHEPIPTEEINKIIKKLAEKEFKFKIKFNKEKIKAEINGKKINNRVKIDGVWYFNGSMEKITAIGVENDEYRLENKKWVKTARTNETNPIYIIDLVCSFNKFEFYKSDNKYFIYKFEPNLLFMDPTLIEKNDEQRTQGFIYVNKNNYLPENIIAQTKDGRIKWEIEIKNVNKKEKIIIPIAKTDIIKILAHSQIQKVAEIIKNRFILYGVEDISYKIKKDVIEIKIIYLYEKPDSIIKALTEMGKIEIYTAQYPSEKQYEIKGAHFVKGNPTNPIYLIKKLDIKIEKVEEKDDFLYLTTDKELPKNTKIAVVCDNEVIEVIPEVWGKEIKIKPDELTKIKMKLPLPVEVKIIK